ncbi:MAG: aminopeptidase [Tissierellia bacterium]|nr:aminopeptidase [Tissierellia bacterium]
MSLSYERSEVWSKKNHEDIFSFAEGYKKFLSIAKTERLAHRELLCRAKEKGFRSFEELKKEGNLLPGAKLYLENKNKSLVLMVLGADLEEGMRVVGSHIDVPRLDLKQVPLYEEGKLAFFKTHYYGGVKKYQWTCIPLALHGLAYTKEGKAVELSIGEEEEDPVFYINDLLIHLSADQMQKKLSEAITGEQLNVVVGHMPLKGEEKEAIKAGVLKALNDKYGLIEEDFLVSEIEVVPAGKARDVGFDRSMVAGHGHDDRACAYASLRAILEIEAPQKTAVCLFADKEEIGSVGNSSMEALFFENLISEILAYQGKDSSLGRRRALAASKVLSADVSACFDPNFPEVTEKLNTAHLGCGGSLNKYTGVRGKGGSNDANAEFLQELRELFDKKNVLWQTGELGKVDQGGGGTIAFILAKYGAEVVDFGLPVLSMHAPIELISKADLYAAYEAYKAFME